MLLIFREMNKPYQRCTSGPSPQWQGSCPQVRMILSFGITPLLKPGGRNKRVQETILLDQLRGWQQVGSPNSSSSLYCFSSFFPSEAYEIDLPRGSGITVLLKPGTQTLPVKLCYIISKRWETTLSIKAGEKKVFSFSCQDPHNYFVIEIQKNIGKYSLVDSLASVSSFQASPASTAREVRPVLKLCTLFSFYVASHSPKRFAWFQVWFFFFLLILKAALREVLRGSHLPKMAQLVCLSKTGTPSILEFWIQSVCLWPLCHTVSWQSCGSSGDALSDVLKTSGWAGAEVQGAGGQKNWKIEEIRVGRWIH